MSPASDAARFRKFMREGLSGGKIPGVMEEDLYAELMKGIKVESEHTSDPEIAMKIAMDHLAEYPEYYTELAKMERKLEKKAR